MYNYYRLLGIPVSKRQLVAYDLRANSTALISLLSRSFLTMAGAASGAGAAAGAGPSRSDSSEKKCFLT